MRPDRLTGGLVEALSVYPRQLAHQPGRIVAALAVMLPDGGDCLADLGALRDQEALFGSVASGATAYRCIERLDEGMLARMRKARAAARTYVEHGLRPTACDPGHRRHASDGAF